MTCESCGDKPKKCNKDFTKAVIEIDNPEQITLMRRVVIPASMGDDTTVPPTVGKYKNVLLFYEANTKSYLYSSDGIPTQLVNGVTDYEAAVNLPKINGVTLLGNQSSADLKLANAPVIISLDSGQWSSDKTIGQIFDAFNAGTAIMLDFGNPGTEGTKAWPVVQLGYNAEDNMLLGVVSVAQTENASDFTGEGGYGVFKLYDDHSAEIDNIDWQRKMSVTDDTGLSWDGETLSGVPATDTTIGMVKPGDGLSVDAGGELDVNVGDGVSIDSDNVLNINIGEGLKLDADNNIYAVGHIFDTVADMKAATDLADGSYAKTLGYYVPNDGGGALYRIANNTPSGYYESLTSGLYAEIIINDKISTAQIGIVGDGTTDETAKLQSFFDINSEKYYVNNGNILIDGDINIPSNSTIEFSEDAKITRKATSLDTYFMFNIINKHDIKLVNIHLVGDRDTHIGSNGEWGYGINIAYSYNIEVLGATIEKTWGDGIYIGTSFTESKIESVSNILCKDCRILNCSRNGISICAGKDIRIIDCRASGIDRVAPKSGMDIEVEYPVGTPENLENVYILNFNSDNCDIGLQTHITQGTGKNIIIENHHSDQDNYGYVCALLNYQSNLVYKNSVLTRFKKTGVYITGLDVAQNSNLMLQNLIFDGTTVSSNSAIWILGNSSTTTGNIIIDDITVQNTFGLYEPEFALNTYWYEDEDRSFSNIVLKNICDEGTSGSKRYYTRGRAIGKPTYADCKIKRTISGTYYLADNFMNYINLNPATATTLVVNPSVADGTYTYEFNNNSGGIDHVVQFPNGVVVYNGNTQVHNGTGNKYLHITSVCCKLVFTKANGVINIVENNGITL